MQNQVPNPALGPMPTVQGMGQVVPQSHGTASVMESIARVTIRGMLLFVALYALETFAPDDYRPSSVLGGAIGNLTGSNVAAREEMEAAYKQAMADVDLYLSEKEKELQEWLDGELKRNEIELAEAVKRLELQQQDVQVRRDIMQGALAGQAFMSSLADMGCGIGQMAGDMRVTASTCGLGTSIRQNMQNELNGVAPSGTHPFRN